jgi:hypothetical protein
MGMVHKEVRVAQYVILSRNLPAEPEENYENPQAK